MEISVDLYRAGFCGGQWVGYCDMIGDGWHIVICRAIGKHAYRRRSQSCYQQGQLVQSKVRVHSDVDAVGSQ